jgi:mannose-6-phosphate isomerase-like protein (cupin superfamily)
MAMREAAVKIYRRGAFRADRAWGCEPLMDTGEHGVRLHWTDQPYRWHVNRGDEVFVVLDGEVDMHVGPEGAERVERLRAGDTVVMLQGERHLADPVGEARVLVVERHDSD